MKNLLKHTVFAAMLLLFAGDASAQLIVNVRPARPTRVVTRTVAPSPNHVWVEEDWRPHGRTYRWHGGYWAAPPRTGAVWTPGHWEARPHGEVWIPGNWR